MKRPLVYKGSFYPQTKSSIDEFIQSYSSKISLVKGLKGLIVPHAGWIYSGETALKGFAHIPEETINRIYLVGPSHRVSFKGAAICSFTSYEAESGDIRVDRDHLEALLDIEDVHLVDEAHIHEHSLEVQLEFIRTYYPEVSLIPVVAGMDCMEPLSKIFKKALKETGALIIISSDLSHYQPYLEAREQDLKTINSIEKGELLLGPNDACGAAIINAFQKANNEQLYRIKLIDYRNSGDTAGDKKSVVGYCSMEIIDHG